MEQTKPSKATEKTLWSDFYRFRFLGDYDSDLYTEQPKLALSNRLGLMYSHIETCLKIVPLNQQKEISSPVFKNKLINLFVAATDK